MDGSRTASRTSTCDHASHGRNANMSGSEGGDGRLGNAYGSGFVAGADRSALL